MKTLPVLASLLLFASASVQAAELVEAYTAVLSERDHFNSNGERLNSAAAIIRQDRANLHKFGKGDPGDEGDRYFAKAENRARLEGLLQQGAIDPALRRMIVNGTPVVLVQVYRGTSGDYVNVSLAQ